MAAVTFTCVCPDCHVSARIESDTGVNAAELLFEDSGKKTVELASGLYSLAYRAQGIRGTPFVLKAGSGAVMPAIDRTMPADGFAAGVRTLVVKSLALTLALAWPAAARAQQDAVSHPANDAMSISPRAAAERALTTLPNISDVLTPGYYLSFEASTASKTATATIAVDDAAGAFSASLSLEAPLSESPRESRPLTLDGLANSAAATGAVHWFFWPGGPDTAGMQRLCERATGRTACDDSDLTRAADRHEFLRLAHAGNTPTTINARATIGRRAFRFVDEDTLASEETARTSVALAAGLGHYAPRTGYIAAQFQFVRDYDAGDTEQLCALGPGGGLLACRSAVVGGPVRRTREGGSVEWRLFLPGGRVAVNPSFARDVRGRTSAVSVPIYFLSLAAGGLAGGARASWRSDEPGVTVAVFVGAALHLTN
jgi:hypothetical protein